MISYIDAISGIYSKQLDDLSVRIWNWCLKRDIIISAQNLPWCENIYADALYRQFADSTEFIFENLQTIFPYRCS